MTDCSPKTDHANIKGAFHRRILHREMLDVVQNAELDLSWPLKSLIPTTEYLTCMLDSCCMQQAQLLWSSVWYIALALAGTVSWSPDISLTLIISVQCTTVHPTRIALNELHWMTVRVAPFLKNTFVEFCIIVLYSCKFKGDVTALV